MPRGKRVAKKGAAKKSAVKKTTTKKTGVKTDTGYVVALKKPPTDPLGKVPVVPSESVTPPDGHAA